MFPRRSLLTKAQRSDMLKNTRISLFLMAGLLFAAQAQAQDLSVLPFHADSKVWIDGTSNRSDWTVHATELEGHVKMNPEMSAATPGVEEVQLKVTSKKIVSRKSTIMDRLMYGALKADDHPEIVYELTSVESVTPSDDDPNAFVMQTLGNLTLAGQTKEIEMIVTGVIQDNGQVVFTGQHALSMPDYGIKPPTAMFGALHTGPDVMVHAELVAAPGGEGAGSQ